MTWKVKEKKGYDLESEGEKGFVTWKVKEKKGYDLESEGEKGL